MKNLLLVLALLVPGGAGATTMIEMSGPELAALSDAIVHARVLRVSGHVSDTRVFTDAELLVIDGLKGALPGTKLFVSYPGGVSGGLGMRVAGQVSLREGAECVLYLNSAAGGRFMPAAMRQGFFDVRPREYDGVRIAYRTTEGLALMKRGGAPSDVNRLDDTPRSYNAPLVDLLSDIKKEIEIGKTLKVEDLPGGKP